MNVLKMPVVSFIRSWALMTTILKRLRHEICPKFYIARFSGQTFYTVKFLLISSILVIKTQRNE